MSNVNATCFTKHAAFQGPPLIQDGQLRFQAHHVGWIVATLFTLVAVIASFWLISKHLTWYTQKRQQRYIVRLLLMVPIYSIVSLASYIFWNHAIPITLARDSYEAFVLYSFFYLLLQYLSPTVEGQKDVFRHVVLEKWMFPLGFVRYRPEDGLYFLQLMKWGVLQYCVIRPTTTLAAVILDSVGLYCEASWSPGWGHIYITVIVSISVSVGMYCLIQLYLPVSAQLAPHKPLLKLFSVKAVVFLTFWQATGLSVLSMVGVIKDTSFMTAEDINTGIYALLETFEMVCFAFLHFRAFSYRPYREGKKTSDKTPRFRSLLHALDFRDVWHEIWYGSIYMSRTMRGVEAEEEVRRRIHFARVMGRERELKVTKGSENIWLNEETWDDRDTLLVGDQHGRGRSRRDVWLRDPGDSFGPAFGDEVREELRRRDLDKELLHDPGSDPEDVDRHHKRGQTSWWRGLYDRFVQGSQDPTNEERLSPVPRRSPRSRRSPGHHRFPSLDSPPPSAAVLFEYSAPGDGRSNVRLAHSPRRAKGKRNSEGGSNDVYLAQNMHRHRKVDNAGALRHPHAEESPRSDVQEFPKAIPAPQPPPARRSSDIQLVVTRDENPTHRPEPSSHQQYNEDLLMSPSAISHSDSVLGRVFSVSTTNSQSSTANGHASSGDRINSPLSEESLSTQLMFPQALSPSLIMNSPTEGQRARQFSTPVLVSSPEGLRSNAYAPTPPSRPSQATGSHGVIPIPNRSRGPRRPEIVLPAPLSPARYYANVAQSGGSPPIPITHYHSRRAEVPPSPPVVQPDTPMDRSHDHKSSPNQHIFNGNNSARRYSQTPEQPRLNRQLRTPKRKSLPAEGIDTSMADSDGPLLDTHRLSDSPLGGGPAVQSATTPSPPLRALRHAGDNIGKMRGSRSRLS